ncbi:histidinol-phosphate transaminase [Mailhella sp.]|uniref:histidinol-phosphate transaminase n=1 Tax=Mailhella sp. TaxID=1981029 RepID=UPI003AB6315A
MTASFTSFNDVRPEVAAFESYEPGLSIAEIAERYGLSRVIKMASNENPLGVSPRVREVIAGCAGEAFRYPQSGNPRLVKALASYYGVDAGRIFVGNGSDEVIDLLFRVRAIPGVHNAAVFRPCFGLYPTQAQMAGVELRQVPLKPDFTFDFDGLLKVIDENTTLVIVTSPDNPSGRVASIEDLEALARALPPACLLVVDEAYIEFAGEEHSLLSRLNDYPNVAIMRTFSKVYGLAGLRIGYAILPPAIADYMWRVRLPFSLNILAEEAALAALADGEFRDRTVELVKRGRARLTEGLRAMGCEVTPSLSNFIMFRLPEGDVDAKTLHGELLKRGVIIRALGSYHLPDRLRVSVGTDEENELFLRLVREILGK